MITNRAPLPCRKLGGRTKDNSQFPLKLHVLILLLFAGCTGTTNSDHSHQTEHSHKNGHDHTHSAGAVEGLHGGTVVAIGHSHGKDKVTHYYAEVMPVTEQQLTLHLLAERPSGEVAAQSIEKSELVSYLNRSGDPQLKARKLVLTAAAATENSTAFSGQLPEEALGKQVKVVIPRIRIAGERMSFSFELDVPVPPSP